MTHDEIEQREIVDAYVRGSLSDSDRQTFEEHFFTCDRCFADVRTAQRFSDAVNDAVGTGLLPGVEAPPARRAANWLRPAFALSAVVAVALGAVIIWFAGVALPQARESARLERQRADGLAAEVSRQQMAKAQPPPSLPAGGNLPLVMLEASRAESSNALKIPVGASQAALWMEPGAGTYTAYRLEIESTPPVMIDGLVRNAYGALAAVVPAARLTTGRYRVRLFGKSGARETLTAEYRLDVQR